MRRQQKQTPLTSVQDANHLRRQDAIRRAYSAASLRRPEAKPQSHRPAPNPRVVALLHAPTPAYRPPPTPTLAMLRETPQSMQESTSRADFCDPELQMANSAAYHEPTTTHRRSPHLKAAWRRSPGAPGDELGSSRQLSMSSRDTSCASLPGFSHYSGALDDYGANLLDEGRRAYREQRGKGARRITYVQ